MAELTIDLAVLPHGVRVYVAVLGVQKALKLLQEHQNRMFYIPAEPGPEHEFSKVFGTDLAMRIAQEHGCKSYQVPTAGKVLAQLRNRQIIEAYKAGAHVNQLVEQFGLTRQHITNLVRQAEPDAAAIEDWLGQRGDGHLQQELF
ncbi:Mor transcription activator family protein [Pseudoalteromonas rubra]|uniref:Mor transcription activator domain-containing protein n=1 Tax=Pseudoalteromonas rubra TaxID=43658 RepID=A0A0U2P479_9GAMM|nr:Mor transcription activator family protein [Pseudoalteromonas rubra]ALU41917.1 hypothetical protein AT705_02620 [Pseudoalteromonas rubra]